MTKSLGSTEFGYAHPLIFEPVHRRHTTCRNEYYQGIWPHGH